MVKGSTVVMRANAPEDPQLEGLAGETGVVVANRQRDGIVYVDVLFIKAGRTALDVLADWFEQPTVGGHS